MSRYGNTVIIRTLTYGKPSKGIITCRNRRYLQLHVVRTRIVLASIAFDTMKIQGGKKNHHLWKMMVPLSVALVRLSNSIVSMRRQVRHLARKRLAAMIPIIRGCRRVQNLMSASTESKFSFSPKLNVSFYSHSHHEVPIQQGEQSTM